MGFHLLFKTYRFLSIDDNPTLPFKENVVLKMKTNIFNEIYVETGRKHWRRNKVEEYGRNI